MVTQTNQPARRTPQHILLSKQSTCQLGGYVCTLSGLALARADLASSMPCPHQPGLQPRMLRCLSMSPVGTSRTGCVSVVVQLNAMMGCAGGRRWLMVKFPC